jgi:hypothetical protein
VLARQGEKVQGLVQHFTPLNLHLNDTQQTTQLNEPDKAECLCEYICQLLLCSNIIDVQLSLFIAGSNEVILDIDVFSVFMENGILAQSDS